MNTMRGILIAVMAGLYGCDDSDHDGNGTREPAVPELRAISAEQAVELAAYLRRVRVQGGTGEVPSRQLVEADAADETGGAVQHQVELAGRRARHVPALFISGLPHCKRRR